MILENENVKDTLIDTGNSPFCSKKDFLKFKENKDGYGAIQKMLELLQQDNMHFGYRVINEISRFINNCIQEIQPPDLNSALDVQIVQKILPKFHGTRAKLEEPLTELFSFCFENQPSNTDELSTKAIKFDKNARYPRSAQKIAQMLRQLSIQGYASFIE